MNKTKKILVFVALIPLVILLKLYFFPASEVFKRTYKYAVKNEKGNTVDCKIYESDKEGFIVIMFNDKNRLYVSFKEKHVGFAQHAYDNYKLTEDYLYLFKGNLFYRDGIRYKRISFELDGISIKFNGFRVEIGEVDFSECVFKPLIIEKQAT
jgi:hypothetical protein